MLRSSIDRCFVLTAPGVSALATVRLAGPGVIAFIARRFSKRVVPNRPTHGDLRDDAGVIDDPVIVLRADGFAADITLHGGAWIAKCVTTLAQADGFEVSPVDAETIGSTDARSIFEHEVLISLPSARTERAASVLLAQRTAWEAFVASAPSDAAIGVIAKDQSLEHLLNPPTLAIVGLPNAGKSTLANQLFGQQRSIVSPIAGTTRDWIGEEANLDGLIVKLIDTPGRRLTTDAIEAAAIAASDSPIATADAVLLLLDGTRDDEEQRFLLGSFPDAMVLLNKADERLSMWSDDRLTQINAILVNALAGVGVPQLITRVHKRFGVAHDAAAPRVWTRRQRVCLSTGNPAAVLT